MPTHVHDTRSKERKTRQSGKGSRRGPVKQVAPQRKRPSSTGRASGGMHHTVFCYFSAALTVVFVFLQQGSKRKNQRKHHSHSMRMTKVLSQ